MLFTLLGSVALAALPPTTPLTDAYACRGAGAMVGPEDFVLLPGGEARRAIVSASRYREGDVGESDGFFALDLETGQDERLPVQGRDGCGLHPHGVFLGGTAEAPELWAVVHFRAEDAENPACDLARDDRGRPVLDAVERYRVDAAGLTWLARLQDPLMTEPNDLFVAPDGRIFLSNNPEIGMPGYVAGAFLAWRPSEVLGYSPDQGWTVIARRFFYSNGVLLDDRGELLVSSYGGKLTRLREQGGRWERVETLRLQGALDNLMIGEDGRLWVAGHPSPIDYAKHAEDAAKVGPSVAYALSRAEQGWTPEDRILDQSGTVQASSTVTKIGGELVFAQVFQPGLVVCAPR